MQNPNSNNQKQQKQKANNDPVIIQSQIDTKPIVVSWMINNQKQQIQEQKQQIQTQQQQQNQEEQKQQTNNNQQATGIQLLGKFGCCHCPGKKLAKGRDGKSHNRDIHFDVKQFNQNHNISVIICLLNDYELRTLGVDVNQYKKACNNNKVQFLQFPIIEMAGPECSIQEFDKFVEENIISNLNLGKGIVTHCRGGIGRAGLLASCIYLKTQICQNPKQAIQTVRNNRDPRCVESKKQADFIEEYFQYLKNKK